MTDPEDGAGPPLRLLSGPTWDGAAIPGERSVDLVCALVEAAPRAVSARELVDEVWPEEEPAHAAKALQVLVSRTRTRTDPRLVERTETGYRLGLRDDEVDALLLRRQVAAADAAYTAGDLDVVRHAVHDALAVPVTAGSGDDGLADVPRDSAFARLLARAEADRSRAGLLLGRVLLARGDAAAALPHLEQGLADLPNDEERLVDVLRAEADVRGVPAALARYAEHQERVRDTLGAEPGPALRRLHAELLARDSPVRQGLKYDAAPMIGRDEDVALVRALLDRFRVVSIVGAGGLGKTRMAHLVGRLASQPIVQLVELAGVNSPDGVLVEVATALGVRESMTSVRTAQLRSSLRSRVIESLGSAPTLLILDNCEHVIEAVADLVAVLVAATDGTRVLTTSRAPLGIAAEQVYQLPQLDQADAATLFVQRARAARSDVRLDADELAALVGRLDGLPLAVELAAAKVRVMSVGEISRRLEDRFALLAGHDRSAPARHQTLEAVIAWSWNLLREEDREALRTLAVFPDGFSLAGADEVLGRDALASVSELVDQSLLVVREGATIRYRFLETVREYGLKQLGDPADVRARVRGWATRRTRAAVDGMFGPEQVRIVASVREEAGNFAGVMRWAMEERDGGALVPLVGALVGYWTLIGDHLAVLGLAGPVLEILVDEPDPDPDLGPEEAAWLRGLMAALIVNTTIFTGRPPEVAIARLRRLGLAGDGSRTDAMARLLLEVYADGEPDLAVLDRLCDDPDPRVSLLALQWATQAQENAGELDAALAAVERALAVVPEGEGPWSRALLEAQAAGLLTQAGDWDACVAHAERAVPVMDELGAAGDAIELRTTVALAGIARGRLDEAERLLARVSADERELPAAGWPLAVQAARAELALARGEVDTGLALLRESVGLARGSLALTDAMPAEMSPRLLPWVLFAESAAIVAHLLHDRADDARPFAEELIEKLPELFALPLTDYPVVGGALVARGLWALQDRDGEAATDAARDAAVRLVVLGRRFGYHRTHPSLAWERVARLVEASGAVDLPALVAEYDAQPSVSWRGEVRRLLELLGPT